MLTIASPLFAPGSLRCGPCQGTGDGQTRLEAEIVLSGFEIHSGGLNTLGGYFRDILLGGLL